MEQHDASGSKSFVWKWRRLDVHQLRWCDVSVETAKLTNGEISSRFICVSGGTCFSTLLWHAFMAITVSDYFNQYIVKGHHNAKPMFRNFPILRPILPLQLAGRTDGVFLDVWVSLTSYFWVYAFSFCLLRCVFRGNWCRLRKLKSIHLRVQKQSKVPLLTVDLSTHDTSPTRQIGSPLALVPVVSMITRTVEAYNITSWSFEDKECIKV